MRQTRQETMLPPELLLPGTSLAEPADANSRSLWAVVDDRLRGRWYLMLALGALLGLFGAWYGWRSSSPVFRSTGTIRVAPRLPFTLDRIAETEAFPHFPTFVGTQVELIRSRRVIERALKDEAVASLPFATSARAPAILEKGVAVEAQRGSQLIFVSYLAEHPRAAQGIVSAVIDSYVTIWGQAESGEIGRKLDRLGEIEQERQRELRAIRTEVNRVIERHGAADLVELHNRRLMQLEEVEALIARAELTMLQAEDAGDETAGPAVSEVDQRQLEAIDPRLADLRFRLDQAETAYDNARYRYRPNSGFYQRAEADYDMAKTNYDDRVQELLADWDTVMAQLVQSGGDVTPLGMTPEQLRREIDALEVRREGLAESSQQLLTDIKHLEDLDLQEENQRAELKRVEQRRKQLEIEEPIIQTGRITVVQDATLPVEVYADSRKKRAAFGLVVGFAASFGAFFLLGTLDRRAFGTAQLGIGAAEGVVCLGVLPDLRRKSSDRETTDVASHCVHQIRNQIEVRREPYEKYTLAVTSPHQGDGKTSVVMALGWSYAAAGYETLLLDCDLVGRSLTRQLGLIARPGLKEAMIMGTADGDVVSLPVPHLAALPAGLDSRFGPEAVRQRDLNRLLDELRQRFDMIIIDTGPLLGSLESTPVVATADGVVILMRRGRSRSRLTDVIERLRGVGATCLGVILNGAVRAECDRYVSEASLAAHAEPLEPERLPPGEDGAATREPNVLMLAMETTSRPRGGESDEDDDHAS